MTCSSLTDESNSKPGHAPQGMFTLDGACCKILPQPYLFSGVATSSEYVGLDTLRLGCVRPVKIDSPVF